MALHLLDTQPVLVHRDLQSSNILLVKGEIALIDFQGMRWGPAVYDLASLICDPYVKLERELKEELIHEYASIYKGQEDLLSLFWWAAAQRLIQALGAYVRLSQSSGTRRFQKYIPSTLKSLAQILKRLNLPNLYECVCSIDYHRD